MTRSTITLTPLLLVLSLGAIVPLHTRAEEMPDVEQIVRETNRVVYYQGDDGRARATMTIRDAKGRERVKEFTILRRDVEEGEGDQRFYVYFHAPSDERGTTFIVWKHLDKEDDRWLYLPALDVQKRIAATDKRTSFVGSHFFYEDVSGRRLTDDRHELIEITDTYYVLKNTPKDPDLVEFDSYTMWIHKATFIPVEVKYERGGEVYRVAKTLAVEEVQGHMTVTRSQMTDLRTGGSTTMEYASVEYDVGLTDDVFTERYLRTPPTEYVK
jgi:outer membrane lipoprotein-sorting protein